MEDFSSKQYNNIYNNFKKMFDEEGDVYESVKESVLEDYEHTMINSPMAKKLILSILQKAAVEYYIKNIKVIKEEEILKLIINEN